MDQSSLGESMKSDYKAKWQQWKATLQELKDKMAEAASEDVAAELLTSAPARVKEFHLSVKNYQKLLQMNIF